MVSFFVPMVISYSLFHRTSWGSINSTVIWFLLKMGIFVPSTLIRIHQTDHWTVQSIPLVSSLNLKHGYTWYRVKLSQIGNTDGLKFIFLEVNECSWSSSVLWSYWVYWWDYDFEQQFSINYFVGEWRYNQQELHLLQRLFLLILRPIPWNRAFLPHWSNMLINTLFIILSHKYQFEKPTRLRFIAGIPSQWQMLSLPDHDYIPS